MAWVQMQLTGNRHFLCFQNKRAPLLAAVKSLDNLNGSKSHFRFLTVRGRWGFSPSASRFVLGCALEAKAATPHRGPRYVLGCVLVA